MKFILKYILLFSPILVKSQNDQTTNGIYIIQAAGNPPIRSLAFAENQEFAFKEGKAHFLEETTTESYPAH